MAVVYNPLLSQEAHGKVGGTEYRQIRGRSVVGRVSLATPQRTLHTGSARVGLDRAAKAWRQLSSDDRAMWAAAASSPELGFQLWVQRACLLYSIGGELPSSTHDDYEITPLQFYTLSAAPGPPPTVSQDYFTPDPGSAWMAVYWQPKQRTSPNPSPYRWLLIGTADPTETSFELQTPQYHTSYHIRIRLINVYSGEIKQEHLDHIFA